MRRVAPFFRPSMICDFTVIAEMLVPLWASESRQNVQRLLHWAVRRIQFRFSCAASSCCWMRFASSMAADGNTLLRDGRAGRQGAVPGADRGAAAAAHAAGEEP